MTVFELELAAGGVANITHDKSAEGFEVTVSSRMSDREANLVGSLLVKLTSNGG